MDIDLVIDASAILAILFEEANNQSIRVQIAKAAAPTMCPSTILECTLALSGRVIGDPRVELHAILEPFKIKVGLFDEECAHLACSAFMRFGKGRHRASLNFGDCMVYGFASKHRVPILCTGNDFAQTDIAIAKLDN